MKRTLSVIAIAALLSACAKTPSNVHVIATTDCGATWKKLNTGDMVPKHTGNVCGYNTAIPNWPMAGDAQFKTQFAKGVLSNMKFTYSYSITNPIAFISEARYLGKMGTSLEISASSVGGQYEMAENIIIDKLLREVTTDITRNIEVVDANPGQLEDQVYDKTKEILAKKGIALADLALVVENDEQTRLAIDSATAMRVYSAAGIPDVGKQIIVARSGASRISVTNNNIDKQEKK